MGALDGKIALVAGPAPASAGRWRSASRGRARAWPSSAAARSRSGRWRARSRRGRDGAGDRGGRGRRARRGAAGRGGPDRVGGVDVMVNSAAVRLQSRSPRSRPPTSRRCCASPGRRLRADQARDRADARVRRRQRHPHRLRAGRRGRTVLLALRRLQGRAQRAGPRRRGGARRRRHPRQRGGARDHRHQHQPGRERVPPEHAGAAHPDRTRGHVDDVAAACLYLASTRRAT